MAINNVGRALPLPTQPTKPAGPSKEADAGMGAAKAGAGAEMTKLSQAASQLAPQAGEPPVDAARVSALKAAIADGSYHVDPEQVARSMLDFEDQLNGR